MKEETGNYLHEYTITLRPRADGTHNLTIQARDGSYPLIVTGTRKAIAKMVAMWIEDDE